MLLTDREALLYLPVCPLRCISLGFHSSSCNGEASTLSSSSSSRRIACGSFTSSSSSSNSSGGIGARRAGCSSNSLSQTRGQSVHLRLPSQDGALHHSCLETAWRSSQWAHICGRAASSYLKANSLATAAVKRWKAGPQDSSINTSQLLQLGFTETQSARILANLHKQKLNLNVENVRQWLQLLHSLGVEKPLDTLSQQVVLMQSKADNASLRAGPLQQWMAKLGLTEVETGKLFSKYGLILKSSVANVESVEAWLGVELGWGSDVIRKALIKDPRLFGRSVTQCQSQLSALQALGLSRSQTGEMVRKMPVLLSHNVSNPCIQLKVRFLLEVMQLPITALVSDPNFLNRSLTLCIGPRWAFHSKHCKDARFPSTSTLSMNPTRFTDGLKSSSLDSECLSREVTRLQLFREFVIQWQQGEGKAWVGLDGTRSATLDGDSSTGGDMSAD